MKRFVSNGLIALLAAGMLGIVAPNVHADNFFVNPPVVDHQIQQVNNDNALSYYDDSTIKNVNNQPPSVQTGAKYAKTRLYFDQDNSTHTYDTTPTSQQANSFNTKWFLPDGFNVSRGEHGNYQSVAIAGNNLYLVESMGTGTNQGAIVKYNIDDLNKLGLLQPGNQDQIWKAFEYFNPYTKQGSKNNKAFIEADSKVQSYEGTVNNLTKQSDKLNQKLATQNNAKNNADQQIQNLKDQKRDAKYKKNDKFKQSVNNKLAKWHAKKSNHKQNIVNLKNSLKPMGEQIDQASGNIDKIKSENPNSFTYARIEHTAQLSPLLDIGHGQTLAYNPTRQSLFLAQDDTTSDLSTNDSNQLTEIDPNTLQPLRQYHFKMLHNQANYQLHTLAFDKDGNAYMGRNYGKDRYRFFKGSITDNSISFEPSPQTVKRPRSSVNQYLSYNPANNRLYFVTNDNITSLPTDKLNNGQLKSNDVQYTTFNTGREFEGLGFDDQGYGYLLMLWEPEIMESKIPMH